MVGPPVKVTGELLDACQRDYQYGHLIFELYKEATSLVCISAGVGFRDNDGRPEFKLDQAICVGLLVRISKYMTSVVKLSSGIEHADVVQALNRCIIESSVNLQYLLIKRSDPRIFARFQTSSLKGERILFDIINENIERRSKRQLKIEYGMLQSILETCELSGVSIEDIDLKSSSWGGNFRQKLKVLGLDDGYVFFQMMPSHAIHGDWVDLVKNHLVPSGDGFVPNFDWNRTDGVLLNPVAIFVVDTAREYLSSFFNNEDTKPVHERLDDLQERLMRVESSLQDWQFVE